MGEKFDKIKSVKQKRFVIEYIACGNATEAYKRAYRTVKNSTAMTKGSELVRNSKILDAINEKFKEIWTDREEDIGKTYSRLKDMSVLDIKDVMDFENGEVRVKDFKDSNTKSIQEFSFKTITKDNVTETHAKVKLKDDSKYLSNLLDVLKMKNSNDEPITVKIIPAVRPDRKKDEQDDDK